jgi:hypothetical protein
VDGSESTTDTLAVLHPDDNGAVVEITEEIKEIVELWQTEKQIEKEAKEAKDKYRNQLAAALGDATFLEGYGTKISYKTQERKGHIEVSQRFLPRLIDLAIPFERKGQSKFRKMLECKI